MTGPRPAAPGAIGVRIAGVGASLPPTRLTNADLEKLMETDDDWIVQRTGIRERRIIRPEEGQSTVTLSTEALRVALDRAGMRGDELDLVILATMTPDMNCPPSSCQVAHAVGATGAGAFDLSAACCGFVFGLNSAYALIRTGVYRNVALVGADTLSRMMDYSDTGRATAILFGDGAGAVVLSATDDTSKGVLAQSMHADAGRWSDLYIPTRADRDFPEGETPDPQRLNRVQMNGRGVFKFAVGTFPDLIAETLDKAALKADEVDMYVCHQSNARILQAARDRFGIPEERLYVNIDRFGNTVAASVPLCLNELVEAGRVKPGQRVMFVAFGGGLTWGSSLWQL